MAIWDYVTYGPQNPLLTPFAEAGRVTGVQAVSKKGLAMAGEAGRPFRTMMGYGEQYNITQAQAGEIGYFAGSLVTPGGWLAKGAGAGTKALMVSESATLFPKVVASKKGLAIAEAAVPKITGTAGPGFAAEAAKGEGLFAKIFGKAPEVAKIPKAAKITEVGAEVAPKVGLGAKAGELPWTTYAGKGLKYGAIGGAGVAALYLGGKAVGGAGTAIDRFFGVTPGVTPGQETPPSPWQPTPWQGAGGETGGFWQNLGAGLGAPGVGVEQNIVPLALIGGGIYLVAKEMGKRKSRKGKGKKR